jgi:succinate-acetate transporter protein
MPSYICMVLPPTRLPWILYRRTAVPTCCQVALSLWHMCVHVFSVITLLPYRSLRKTYLLLTILFRPALLGAAIADRTIIWANGPDHV